MDSLVRRAVPAGTLPHLTGAELHLVHDRDAHRWRPFDPATVEVDGRTVTVAGMTFGDGETVRIVEA